MNLRRGLALLGALLLTACRPGEEAPRAQARPTQTPPVEAPPAERDDEAAAVACDPIEEPPQQSGSHLIGDREPPVPYSSTPPTSGWHASGAFTIAVHGPDDPLSEPMQVSVLEAGGVVVTYRDLSNDERTTLEEHVRQHHDGRVAVTPYPQLDPGHVAFTAWGTLQRCPELDLAALDAFVAEHADEDPDTPGTH